MEAGSCLPLHEHRTTPDGCVPLLPPTLASDTAFAAEAISRPCLSAASCSPRMRSSEASARPMSCAQLSLAAPSSCIASSRAPSRARRCSRSAGSTWEEEEEEAGLPLLLMLLGGREAVASWTMGSICFRAADAATCAAVLASASVCEGVTSGLRSDRN